MPEDKLQAGRGIRVSPSSDEAQNEMKRGLALRKKFLGRDDAQLLTEEVHANHPRAMLMASLAMDVLILIGIFLLTGIIGAYFFILPRFIRGLPLTINHPYQNFQTYKRVIKGNIEYYPHQAAVATSTLGILQQAFEHGASFSLLSSSDVVSQYGFEGVVRIGIDNEQPLSNPDIDILYKTIWGQDVQTFIAYLLFNEWPKKLPLMELPDSNRLKWFFYNPTKQLPYRDIVNTTASLIRTNEDEARDNIVTALWENAVRTQFIRWQLGRVFRRDPRAGWVADIYVAVDPTKTKLFLASLKVDDQYGEIFRNDLKNEIDGVSWSEILGWVRSLSGTVTIGIFDRLIHDAQWTIDFDSEKLGAFKGNIDTSIDQLPKKETIGIPIRASDIEILIPVQK